MEIVSFEVDKLPPSVNKIYKRSKNGGLYCDKSVLEFKEEVKNALKDIKFNIIAGPVKLEVKYFV
jgi:Holliday junction resolvase RusA-like endonuclease